MRNGDLVNDAMHHQFISGWWKLMFGNSMDSAHAIKEIHSFLFQFTLFYTCWLFQVRFRDRG